MTKPRKIAAALLVIAVAGVLVAWWRHSSEPEYQGVPLSRWFARYYLTHQSSLGQPAPQTSNSIVALQAMGTNSIHYLGALITAPENSRLFTQLEEQTQLEIEGGHFKHLQNTLLDRVSNIKTRNPLSPSSIQYHAASALVDLKPDTGIILPLLLQMHGSSGSSTRRIALEAMWDLDLDLTTMEAPLIRALKDENENNLGMVARIIEVSKFKSQRLSAALLPALEKTSIPNRLAIFSALESMGTNAVPVLPELMRILAVTTNVDDRIYLARIVYGIDATHVDSLEILTDALRDPDHAIWVMDFLATLHSRQPLPTNVVTEVIKTATNALDSRVTHERIFAARVLLKWVPNHPDAVERLVAAIIWQDSSFALQVLGGAGTNASAAAPQLKALLGTRSKVPDHLILEAIAKIQNAQTNNGSGP